MSSFPELREGVAVPETTARMLAAYREELRAHGFTNDQTWQLVVLAAQRQRGIHVDTRFLPRTAPVAPIRIENFEPGSPEDLAERARFGIAD